MSLRPGYSWSATTCGTRDGSGVPVGADESVPNHDCRYNPSRLRPTAPRMCPPVETKPEHHRTHPRRVPVVHDRLVHLEGYRTGNNRRECCLLHGQYLS